MKQPDPSPLPLPAYLTALTNFDACPKCGGQYWRASLECRCYLCCFTWELGEQPSRVLARARRSHQPPSASKQEA